MPRFIRLCLSALQIAALSMACASSAQGQVSADRPGAPPANPLSRAQVIADLMAWRASGLQALHSQSDGAVDIGCAEYIAATTRYVALLDAARFAGLVWRARNAGLAKPVPGAE